jgi:hypothetical protein
MLLSKIAVCYNEVWALLFPKFSRPGDTSTFFIDTRNDRIINKDSLFKLYRILLKMLSKQIYILLSSLFQQNYFVTAWTIPLKLAL